VNGSGGGGRPGMSPVFPNVPDGNPTAVMVPGERAAEICDGGHSAWPISGTGGGRDRRRHS
jgi:hypothetical protein